MVIRQYGKDSLPLMSIRKGLSHEQSKHEYAYAFIYSYSERTEGALKDCASCIPSFSP